MDEIDLTGKKAAAFGSGDSGYDHFCGAVDLLIEKLQERGAEVVMEGLKVEMSPSDEDIEKCKEFGRKLSSIGKPGGHLMENESMTVTGRRAGFPGK